MTLEEFLLARLDEDEEAMLLIGQRAGQKHAASRGLASCRAKRRLILEGQEFTPGSNAREHFLRLLAAPYADHPDYREEWRP